jgi:UDP-glucose 4-epimerase
MRSVFVAGAAGFIGSHLTDHLLGSGMEVVGFDNLSTGGIANLADATHDLPFRLVIFRFANVVGLRARHGVLFDFTMKLRKDPRRFEVLGDGTQTKSYLHVDDCVDAFLLAVDDGFWTRPVEAYNIGSEDQTNVLTIAQVVKDAVSLGSAGASVTAKPCERAWPRDVRTMQLDISKIRRYVWKPKRNSDEAVRTAANELVHELEK